MDDTQHSFFLEGTKSPEAYGINPSRFSILVIPSRNLQFIMYLGPTEIMFYTCTGYGTSTLYVNGYLAYQNRTLKTLRQMLEKLSPCPKERARMAYDLGLMLTISSRNVSYYPTNPSRFALIDSSLL